MPRHGRRSLSLAAVLLVTGCTVAGCTVTNVARDARDFERDGIDVWNAAHDAARAQERWREIEACPARGTLVYECRSRLWGFVDDFKVNVEPRPRGGSRLELDSRSRVGRNDFGVNAKRIAAYLEAVEHQLVEHPYTPAPAGTAGVGSGSR